MANYYSTYHHTEWNGQRGFISDAENGTKRKRQREGASEQKNGEAKWAAAETK